MSSVSISTFQKKLLPLFIFVSLLQITYYPTLVKADSLSSISDSLSSLVAGASGVSEVITFTTASSVPLQQISVQFSTARGGTTKPLGLNLSSVGLTSVTGIGSGWTLNTSNASSGLLAVVNSSAVPVGSGVAITITFNNIRNSSLGDCQPGSRTLADVCWANIATYSDTGMTNYDNGSIQYTVIEYPKLIFTISGTTGGVTVNGLTSTLTSEDNKLNFQLIKAATVTYLTQKLSITTNAPNGYTIYLKLADPLRGQIYAGQVSPFGATDATWITPKAWEVPTGVVSNSNTGWLGANTNDTRVAGWYSGSGQLGPVSTSKKPVAYSDSAELVAKSIYVTFALGTNALQASDFYSGSIIYSVEPIY